MMCKGVPGKQEGRAWAVAGSHMEPVRCTALRAAALSWINRMRAAPPRLADPAQPSPAFLRDNVVKSGRKLPWKARRHQGVRVENRPEYK